MLIRAVDAGKGWLGPVCVLCSHGMSDTGSKPLTKNQWVQKVTAEKSLKIHRGT